MRYRLIATFLGAPYQAALGPADEEVTLFAACPPPEELGFGSAAGHWRKEVPLADLDGLRVSRPAGWYRGERCLVLDDQGDRLHIAYLGRDSAQARQLGYWEIDRDVFEMVVPRADVSDLTEEQVDVPLGAAAIPSALQAAQTTQATQATRATQATHATLATPLSAPMPVPATPTAPTTPVDPTARADQTGQANHTGQADSAGLNQTTRPAVRGLANPDYSNGYHTPDRVAAWHGSPEPWALDPTDTTDPTATPTTTPRDGGNGYSHYNGRGYGIEDMAGWSGAQGRPGPRTARRERVPIQSVFAELLALAAIPQSAYAVDDEVPGAMCLMKVDGGFEVFASSEEARLEVRFFEDEEAAYFYLFGVLAAEAVSSGHLGPPAGQGPNTHGDQM